MNDPIVPNPNHDPSSRGDLPAAHVVGAPGGLRLSSAWWSRRTRFQLTPLMDLLLIIVFAQFLDVRETSQQQAQSLRDEREKLTTQIARQRSELAGIEEAMNRRNEELQRQRDQARAARDETIAQTDRRTAEVERVLGSVRQWFDLDASSITRGNAFGNRDDGDPDSIDAAIRTARQLADASPDAVVRFLVGHAELLKRAEIWTVHATDARAIRFRAGDNLQSFRLESKTQAARTEEAADRLFAAYKQLPQPKGLVVILASFDPQSVAGVYQPLIDALPQAVERLRMDTPQTRFEYTVLGPAADPTEIEPAEIEPAEIEPTEIEPTEIEPASK